MTLLKKQADLGGDGNDQSFEQAFSNLAHAYLKDTAPGLMEYEVGFQLVDRADDGAKAVGVLGFKVGSNWLYAPCFFINGDLKGHELLYIKSQDAFVPLKENWINYLLSKKPASLGEGIDRDTRNLGVGYPDMNRALQAPSKYASFDNWGIRVDWAGGERAALKKEAAAVAAAMPGLAGFSDWATVAVRDMCKCAAAAAERPPLALPGVLKSGGAPAVATLLAYLDQYPALRPAFERTYDPDTIKEALAAVEAPPARGRVRPIARKPAPRGAKSASVLAVDHRKTGALRVIEHDRAAPPGVLPLLLDAGDRTTLLTGGLLFKDAREDDEVSKAYAVDVRIEFPKRFQNPMQTGLYDVLTADGSMEKCLVVTAPLTIADRPAFAVVVRTGDGKKDWVNTHPSQVWTTAEFKGWKDWFEGLAGGDDVRTGGYYLAIGPSGEGTLPFLVKKSLGKDPGGGECYEVEFDTQAQQPRAERTGPYYSGPPSAGAYGWDRFFCLDREGQRVHLGRKTGTKLRSALGDVYVPSSFKLVKLKDDAIEAMPGDERDKAEDEDDPEPPKYPAPGKGGRPLGRSEEPPLRLGDALDVEVGIFRKTAALEVYNDGTDCTINGRRLPLKRAMVSLVAEIGLREDAAASILKEARDLSASRSRARYRVKYADGYPGPPYMQQGGPNAPQVQDPPMGHDDVMGSGVQSFSGEPQSAPVEDARADPSNRDAYALQPAEPDPQAAGVAQDAAAGGQKEIFDTAMVGSLLRSSRDDTMVDKHIPDLMKGLDRCGRLLFTMFWHQDELAERYGKNEMPELEDSLRNTFEDLGDLVLFLKSKAVEANPDEASQDIDLHAIASQ